MDICGVRGIVSESADGRKQRRLGIGMEGSHVRHPHLDAIEHGGQIWMTWNRRSDVSVLGGRLVNVLLGYPAQGHTELDHSPDDVTDVTVS